MQYSSTSSSPEMKYESTYRAPSSYASNSLPSPPHRWEYPSQQHQIQQSNYITSSTQPAPLSPAPSDVDMNNVWISPDSELNINIHAAGSEHPSPPIYYRQDLYSGSQYPTSFKPRATSMASSYTSSISRNSVQKSTTTRKPKSRDATKSTGRVTCDQCGKSFERPWNLQSHKKTHDLVQPRPYLCKGTKENGERCPNAFKRKTDCTRHFESVHQKLKPWACRMCKHTFSRKDTLTRHEKDGCNKRSHIPSKDGTRQFTGKSFAAGYYQPHHSINTETMEMHLAYHGQQHHHMDHESSTSGSPPPPCAQTSAPSYALRIAPTSYAAQHYRAQTMSSGLPPLSDVVSVPRQINWH